MTPKRHQQTIKVNQDLKSVPSVSSHIWLLFPWFFLGAILISLASVKAGKASAEKFSEKIKDGKVDSKLILQREGEKQLKGYSIISSPQLCAFMIDGKPTVFNMVDIKKIVSNSGLKLFDILSKILLPWV